MKVDILLGVVNDYKMLEIQNILIIANSARMLTQLAANIGYIPLVIDCYSDFDTQEYALDYVKVDSLDLVHVKKALAILKTQFTITHVIYGSGLERYTNTLAFLNQNLCVVGNTVDIFTAIQNKHHFFSKLKQFQIPYPDISFQIPLENDVWLIKPMQGEGGMAIKKFNGQITKPDSCYWQKYMPGMSMSVLFISTDTEYEIIGFNKQLVATIDDNDFVFSGVISQPEISEGVIEIVSNWLKILVFEFGLKGINSLDFILADEQCYVLEVNARPSASMQLYNEYWLAAHINSFLEAYLFIHPKDDDCGEGISNYRAYKIIYAEFQVYIKKQLEWPVWVVDIPKAESFIHTGQPICSIIADGKNEQQVLENLKLRHQQLSKLLQ